MPVLPSETAAAANGRFNAAGKHSTWLIWLCWILAEAVQATIVLTLGWGAEDLDYYQTGQSGTPTNGDVNDAVPLTEYPHAGAWPIYLVKSIAEGIAPGSETAFVAVFIAMCTVLSGVFLWFLINTGRFAGAWLWIGTVLAIGPIVSSRLDLISGLFLGISVAIVAAHPRIAGALLAFATASKLWPGVIAATFVDKWKVAATWIRIFWFALSLAVLVMITVITSGFDRVLSPLTYQSDRGLQVESIAATPFTFLAVFSDRWQIDFTSSKSFEIAGPGIGTAMTVTTVLMAGTIVLALGVALWRFFRGGWTRNRALAFATVLVALLIVSNKVFSPQYVLWIAPLVCLGFPRTFRHPGTNDGGSVAKARRSTVILGVLMLAIATLSFLIFPITYSWLVLEGPRLLPAIFLVFRNAAMVAATVFAFRWWISVEKSQPEISGMPVSKQAATSGFEP